MSQMLRLASLCLLLAVARAQTPTAKITGTVADPTGAFIPGAAVTVTNQDTGVSTPAQSNQSGVYTVSFLIPGKYSVRTAAQGFRASVRQGLTIETGQVLSLDIRLEVGEVAETVTVTGDASLLQSETSSVGGLIENITIEDMPLASRRGAGLVELMGAVAFVNEEDWAGIPNFAMGGGRARQQNWTLDGGNLTGPSVVTGILQVSPPVAAIQEIRVEMNGYPAEFGRSMGGFISMTTKAGTNHFHGELYEYLRNNAFDARSFFAPDVLIRKYNVFGGTVGGPIVRDKTHFFFSYEGTRRRDGVTRVYNVPTLAEIRGDFTGRTGTLNDPLTRSPFPGRIIPASRQDPVGAKLAVLYPEPNVPGAPSGNRNFIKNTANKNTGNSYIARVDHAFRGSDRINLRYMGFYSPITGGRVTPVPAADPSAADQDARIGHLTGAWFHQLRNNLFSELRFTYSRRSNDDPGQYPSTIARDVGLKGVPGDGMPYVNVSGFSNIGPSSQVRNAGPGINYHLADTLSWYRGKHSVRFGFDFRSSNLVDSWGTTRTGRYQFNTVATGNALAALLLGWTTQVDVEAGITSSHSNYFAGFLQDDWKVSRRLTLNIGVRYELETPRTEAQNRQSGFDRFQINPVSKTPGIVTYAGRDGISKYAHDFDPNNFGPRVGFAWRPAGNDTVIRGGYGLMYGPLYDDSVSRANVAGFGDVRQFVSIDNGLTPVILLKDGVPPAPDEPIGPGYGAVKPGDRVRISPDFYDQHQRSTYSHQYNLNVQRRLPGAFLAEISYIANLAHRVSGRTININEIRPELRGSNSNQQILRPFPQYSSVVWRATNWGNSSYHGMNVKAKKRFSGAFNLEANYTWSKFLDDVEAASEAAGASGSGQQSYYARHADKSLSGNHIPHRFIVNLLYDLPFGRNRPVKLSPALDRVAGGWRLGVITSMRTGMPYGVIEATNRMNSFSAAQRSNILRDPELSADRSRSAQIDKWMDTTAFAAPGDGKLGNAARAVGFGPGANTTNLSLLKNFRIREKSYAQFRGEFFNLFNRPNFGLPNPSRGSAAFGTISGAAAGRFLQVGLRIVY
jgi:hypothetical protein